MTNPLGRAFEIRHIIGFEESNTFGNVYFVNHLRWQGRCRELFLREHVPSLSATMAAGLSLVTVRCSCDYFAELAPFDEVVVRMRLGSMSPSRLTLVFEYVRGEECVARGEQQVACMRRDGGRLRPVPVPTELREALRPFGG